MAQPFAISDPQRGSDAYWTAEASRLQAALEFLRPLFPTPPQIALVLGSGLGDLARGLREAKRVLTAEIPGYSPSTVLGHAGAVVAGRMADKQLICHLGRVHLYEGYPIEAVLLPVQVAAALGAKTLILTNASGGIHRHLAPGSLMLIEDQVDLQFRQRVGTAVPNQVRARRVEDPSVASLLQMERGQLYTGGSPYSERLMEIAEQMARQERIKLHRGVLGALTGPSYETPAEVRMWGRIGVDAACMSTAAEAAEGARLGMEVLGISCITNRASGLGDRPLDHAEVIEAANRVKGQFKKLLKKIITEL